MEGTAAAAGTKSLYTALVVLCFAVLGGLTGRRMGSEVLLIAAYAAVGFLFAWLSLGLLGKLLYAFNGQVRRKHEYTVVSNAVAYGFLMMFPFTALAVMADLYLGWNAVQAFTSAGLMTSGGAVGVEVARLGGGRLRSALLPAGWGFLLSAVWMAAAALVGSFLAG